MYFFLYNLLYLLIQFTISTDTIYCIYFISRKYKMGDDKTAEVEPSSLDEKNVRIRLV